MSDEDYPILTAHQWSYHTLGYAVRYVRRKGQRKNIYMHREVTNTLSAGRAVVIDHINRDRLDNRRENLRVTTARGNSYNRPASYRNPTGYKGVKLSGRKRRPYRASIHIENLTIHLGSFDCPHCAALAYNRATIETFGLTSYLNEIPEEHGCKSGGKHHE